MGEGESLQFMITYLPSNDVYEKDGNKQIRADGQDNTHKQRGGGRERRVHAHSPDRVQQYCLTLDLNNAHFMWTDLYEL